GPVGRDPEVGPADAAVGPRRRGPRGQDQPEVRRAGRGGQTSAPDPGAAGQRHHPGVVVPRGGRHGRSLAETSGGDKRFWRSEPPVVWSTRPDRRSSGGGGAAPRRPHPAPTAAAPA